MKCPPDNLLVCGAARKCNLVFSASAGLENDLAALYSTNTIQFCDMPFISIFKFSHAFDFAHNIFGVVFRFTNLTLRPRKILSSKNHPGRRPSRRPRRAAPSPVRGEISVETQPKTFSSSVRSGIFRPPPINAAPDGACDFYKTQNYKYAAPAAFCVPKTNRRKSASSADENATADELAALTLPPFSGQSNSGVLR
jgi:hypothetical protein